MNKILRYYKLLFTLPSNRVVMMILLASYLALLYRSTSLALTLLCYQCYYLTLYYEARVLNGKRLGFLFSVGNFLFLLRPELAITVYSMTSVISNPHFLTPFIASFPLLVFHPWAIIPVTLLSSLVAYGSRNGVTELGIAWLRAWMGDEYEKLERIITSSGKWRTARFYSFSGMVFTDVHFGMMRYSMGTLLPHFMLLHGLVPHRLCGSHENNPANRWETYKLVSELLNIMNNRDTEVYRMSFEKGEDVEAIALRGKKGCVRSLYHKRGADDLPCINESCEVADPHNNEGPNPTKEQVIRELGTLKKTSELNCEVIKICDVEYEGSGLCSQRGKVVVFECNGREYKWFVVPGNNMVRGNRDEIVDEETIEISTFDDHTCAGFGRSKYEVSSIKEYRIGSCEAPKTGHWSLRTPYLSMSDLIYRPDVQTSIDRTIKVGLVGVTLSLLISMLL